MGREGRESLPYGRRSAGLLRDTGTGVGDARAAGAWCATEDCAGHRRALGGENFGQGRVRGHHDRATPSRSCRGSWSGECLAPGGGQQIQSKSERNGMEEEVQGAEWFRATESVPRVACASTGWNSR